MRLSKRRAESVYKYLVKQGVNKKRLSTKAFGESEKVIGSHVKIIRVEFKVVE